MSSTSSTASRRLAPAAALSALLLGGCATTDIPSGLESVAELTDVPFFAQTDYYCGPAALAMILNDAGVAVEPADLVDMVYIEGLRGSLQAELLAATRRLGLLPVPVEPQPRALLDELAGGRPVLVLQNLGFERAPVWHYAVVVGFDAETGNVILRSGEERRRIERTRRFLQRWERAGNWGFIAVPPGELPASATPASYLRALVGAQRQLGESSVAAAYDAALERWPDDPLVLFLAATARHAAAQLADAARLYRSVLALDPDHAAARNNLANVLLDQGCVGEAHRQARLALRSQTPDGEFYSEIADTLRRIEQSENATMNSGACAAG